MFYFSKVPLNIISKQQAEITIRKFASKRQSSLDFHSSGTVIGYDGNYFLGFDGKSGTNFTRKRTLLERYLPKVIIVFSNKDNTECYYMRMGFINTLIAFGLAGWLLVTLISVILGDAYATGFLLVLSVNIFYYLLLLLEVKLTKARVNKCLVSLQTA